MKYSEVSAAVSSDSDVDDTSSESVSAGNRDSEPPAYPICSSSPSSYSPLSPAPVSPASPVPAKPTQEFLPLEPLGTSPTSTATPGTPPLLTSPGPVICLSNEPTFCYTPVTLAPSDINQLTFLSDTDSTVSTVPEIMCRICRSEPGGEKIISPCYCAGSLQHVHESCLLKWLKAYDCVNKHHCELCQYEFKLKAKPWTEWRIPSLSQTEKRRVSCLGIVCFLAVLIVLWSINDLVQNSLHINRIYTDWGFWTKLLFIVFGMFILTFQYPTFRYFYNKMRESNQIVMWGEEGEEQELLETGKLGKCEPK